MEMDFVGFYVVTSGLANYSEYVGTCLNFPFLAGKTYKVNFDLGMGEKAFQGSSVIGDSSVTISLFGTNNCLNIPFSGPFLFPGCPLNSIGFVQLGSAYLTGSGEWVKGTITFTPTININAIVIGGGLPAIGISPTFRIILLLS